MEEWGGGITRLLTARGSQEQQWDNGLLPPSLRHRQRERMGSRTGTRTSSSQGSGACRTTGRGAGSRRQGWITVFCAFPCWQEPLLTRQLRRAGLSPSVSFD